ncbi:MAG: asparagine synthase (glutamine-hydrolyzing) [Verrucomicrobiota bacterium]|nr:asparagine synthase (glutamine-hydrolyzing) [Verrucomicrobiota bacterium]
MCGIAGYVTLHDEVDRMSLLRRMAEGLRHRGPDDEGYFVQPGIGLAVRRLSIVDLPGGHQPIGNEDQTVQVVCNGEIYNYPELRVDLETRGHVFRTNGDTETLVHLYEEHGTGMLRFLRGMFALAIWDSRNRTLFLARDRLGKKPLNYVVADGALYFCSELAPLLEQNLAAAEIDPDALAAYLMFGFISAPRSMVRHIRKLPPAHYLVWRAGEMKLERYWSLASSPKTTRPYDEVREEVRAKLDESLRLRLRSDVPVGLLLSGGLDSNALLARLVRGVGEKVQTFTIGFEEKDYDESEIARASAKHFGVEHHVLMGNTDLLKFLPEVVRHFGEPSADKSALPTMLVCELTRRHVKVALSGDGGDEAFAGYQKHRLTAWQRHSSEWIPREVKERWTLGAILGNGWLGTRSMRKARRQILAEMPSLFSGEFFSGPIYQRIATPALKARTADFLRALVGDFWSGEMEPLERIFHWDNTEPLPNSLLAKLDISSMARSLEVRSPFLDHELVELCARLPAEWKVNHREGKLMLREIVAADLPVEVLRARKRGFSLPLAQWWRQEARQQIRDGILPMHPALLPFLEESAAAGLLDEHQAGRANHAQRLWNLWVLNEWARMFLPS